VATAAIETIMAVLHRGSPVHGLDSYGASHLGGKVV
jgi:hypothetical protein